MDANLTRQFVDDTWEASIIPALRHYLTIPNQSPAFDPEWRTNGYMDRAVTHVADWIRRQAVPGLQLDVVRLEGRTPLLFVEIPGDSSETVLLYGHLDKQPPMHGWRDGLDPWQPVIEDGRLYGRGGADDGYAAFASLTAIRALKLQGVPLARCVIVIEACEESGSGDLPYYIDALVPRIGTPSLVVCLDSGCGNYEQLWITTSLRGLVSGTLSVSTLTEGVHSGAASGIVPSSFRVVRRLLSRLEDECTGHVLPAAFQVENSRRAAATGPGNCGCSGLESDRRNSLPARGRGGRRRRGATAAQPHMAPATRSHRRRRPARARAGRQRAASAHLGQAVAPHSAHARPGRGHGCAQTSVGSRPAVRRTGDVSSRNGRPRAGTRRGSTPGWKTRCRSPRARSSATPRAPSARAARFRSWGCWAQNSRPRNS